MGRGLGLEFGTEVYFWSLVPDSVSVWLGVMLWVNPLSRRGSHLIMDTVYRTHTFLQENRTFQSCTVKDFNFF